MRFRNSCVKQVIILAILTLILPPHLVLAQPTPAPAYPWHENVTTTMFYAGEEASQDNGWIDNKLSAWYSDWIREFGCIDNPDERQNGLPTACFAEGQSGPHENHFYFALPFGDYNEEGVLDQVKQIPWYEVENGDKVYASGGSLLKNRWIEIKADGSDGSERTCYAQWADVGPFETTDGDYVWRGAEPRYQDPETGDRIGLDLSPATTECLGLDGYDTTSWRFVTAGDVPNGPWKTIVTTSPPNWSPPSTPQGALSSLWCFMQKLFNQDCQQYNQKAL